MEERQFFGGFWGSGGTGGYHHGSYYPGHGYHHGGYYPGHGYHHGGYHPGHHHGHGYHHGGYYPGHHHGQWGYRRDDQKES